MTFSVLRTLQAVINAAIDDIERTYHERSPDLDYPSLDEPYYPAGHHTPGEDLAEALKAHPVVAAASKRIVAACGQLSTTVNKPYHGLSEDIQGGEYAECIRFLEAAHIVEILRDGGPAGMHVDEIFKSVMALRPTDTQRTSPLTSSKLSHILRLLATSHYLRELKPNVFANNRRSSFLDSGKPLSLLRDAPDQKYVDTDGVAAWINMAGDEVHKYCCCITDWAFPDLVPTRPIDVNYAGDSKPSTEGDKLMTKWVAPLNLAFNTPRKFFEFLELPHNARRLKRFGYAMNGTRQWEAPNGILQGFDWEDLPEGSVVVDVGGGIGTTAVVVADAHPHLRVVVEDRKQVIENAVTGWGPPYAHLFESGRLSFRARDFFGPFEPVVVPGGAQVASPAVFLLRIVIHNWQDEPAREILTQLRASAAPDTKLIITELLLPYACTDWNGGADGGQDGDGTTTAFPFVTRETGLLPNLGKANAFGYLIDIMMMGTFDTKVRTVDEMKTLALSAGWKFTEVRREPGSLWAYASAIPV
ncbi:S-adenosyl-L-methionine-dependent methyltransferase [Daedaleopsis nitida]|nr:S-adenosyl-L-methionine-dependent methyltransferase [Daedaleopsis nitida]